MTSWEENMDKIQAYPSDDYFIRGIELPKTQIVKYDPKEYEISSISKENGHIILRRIDK